MEIGISLPPNLTLDQQIHYVNKAKELGIDQIWLGDNPPDNNAFVTISSLLSTTEDIKFYTGVTSPFYYLSETILAMIKYFHKNFPNRFGFGVSTGNPYITDNISYIKQPYTHFSSLMDSLIPKIKDQVKDNVPIAIGALGNKMCKYALNNADYLSLNSGSFYDLDRVLIIEKRIKSKKKIIPYVMLEILDDKTQLPTAYIWNMVKGISKSCSKEVLRDHDYSANLIHQLHSRSWDYEENLPVGELRELIYDFAIVGTIDTIETKITRFSDYIKRHDISGIILGWIYRKTQWKQLAKILGLVLID